MCHRSFYERRPGADATRSFFQALRDLFRRSRRPQAEAPAVGAEVIPLSAAAAKQRREEPARRADAA